MSLSDHDRDARMVYNGEDLSQYVSRIAVQAEPPQIAARPVPGKPAITFTVTQRIWWRWTDARD